MLILLEKPVTKNNLLSTNDIKNAHLITVSITGQKAHGWMMSWHCVLLCRNLDHSSSSCLSTSLRYLTTLLLWFSLGQQGDKLCCGLATPFPYIQYQDDFMFPPSACAQDIRHVAWVMITGGRLDLYSVENLQDRDTPLFSGSEENWGI